MASRLLRLSLEQVRPDFGRTRYWVMGVDFAKEYAYVFESFGRYAT